MQQSYLHAFFEKAKIHQIQHQCGGVPYEHAAMLTVIVSAIRPSHILEVGTGIGYSAACLLAGDNHTQLDTIDQDSTHIALAQKEWITLGIADRITVFQGKAEGILPTIHTQYDCIFYDGYVPQNKIYVQFERILRKGGVLITANLYLHDPTGGNYLRKLKNTAKWQTATFADTAIAVKLF